MIFTPEQITSLARQHFNLTVSVNPLPGEIDLNFLVQTPSGEAFTLNGQPEERRENLEFQNAVIQHLAAAGLGLEVPRVVPATTGEYITTITAPDGAQRFLRLLKWD